MTHGVILAGGQSRRMGRPKALLKIAGHTLLRWSIETLRAGGCATITVVTGSSRGRLLTELPADVNHVHASDWHRGMRASLRSAARKIPAGDLLVQHVDAFGVQPKTIRMLISALGFRPVVPRYQGRLGHPVALPKSMRSAIEGSDVRPLSDLLVEREFETLRVNDAGVISNINTPRQFAEILWKVREFRLDDLHRR